MTKGTDTADGAAAAGVIVRYRRDNCVVVIDMGGGYGGAVSLRLKDNGIAYHAFNGAATSAAQSRDGAHLSFRNKRAEAWWRVREMLSPDSPDSEFVALPQDAELKADLIAPTWDLGVGGIVIQSKDEIRKHIGRSPDKGDAVVMCLSEGDAAVKKRIFKFGQEMPTTANRGFADMKRMYQGRK